MIRVFRNKVKQNRIEEVFTKKGVPTFLTVYPAIGIGLIGYILTLDLAYFMPVLYIAGKGRSED